MAGITNATVTIAINTSLSGAIVVGETMPVAVLMPAAWDTAVITFAGSLDGTNYYPIYDAGGTEVTLTGAAAARIQTIDSTKLKGVRWLKLRSGTVGSAVNQTAARTLSLVMQTV
jgi:hypothetical protein